MGVGEVVYNRVLRRLAPKAGGADKRSVQSLAWLVAGMTLEHDVRLERIALAMSGAPTLAGRVRRLRRCLDGAIDVQGIYQRLIADDARWWYVDRVFVVLDTTSVGGRLYFVRLALCHASRALPLAWRAYEGRSATIGFGDYQPLLEAADRLLPRRLECQSSPERFIRRVGQGFTRIVGQGFISAGAGRARVRQGKYTQGLPAAAVTGAAYL